MKGRYYVIVRGEVESVSDVVYLPPDGEGTYVVGTHLMTRQAETSVPGGKPDLLTRLVLGSIGEASSGLAFVFSNMPFAGGHRLSP